MYRALEIAVSRPIVRWKLLYEKANWNSISIRTGLALLPKISADRVQVQQVLMNLMLNGIEAMKDMGGELAISPNKTEDGQVRVSVSDLGVGLSR